MASNLDPYFYYDLAGICPTNAMNVEWGCFSNSKELALATAAGAGVWKPQRAF